MEVAQGGVEPVGVEGADGFVVDEGGAKGDAGVYGVERGAAAAALEGECVGQELGPGGVVGGGGEAFGSAQGLDGFGLPEGGEGGLELIGGAAGFLDGVRGGVWLVLFGFLVLAVSIFGESLEGTALVVGFGGEDAPGDLEAEVGVGVFAVLGEADEAVGVGRGVESADVFSVPADDGDGDLALEEGGEGAVGDVDGFGDQDAFDVAYGYGAEEGVAPLFVGAGDLDPFGFEAEFGAGLVDAEGGHAGGGGVTGWRG